MSDLAKPNSQHFEVLDAIITISSKTTFRLRDGQLRIRHRSDSCKACWSVKGRLVRPDAALQLVGLAEIVDVYIAGERFTWSGKANVRIGNVAEDVELIGTDDLKSVRRELS